MSAMIDLRPVLQIVGSVLCLLAAAMLVPALTDAAVGEPEWQVFVASASVTVFIGLVLVLGARSPAAVLSIRQAFLATVLGWAVPCLFAALPFAFGPLALAPADALFEAASGITATGSTVIAGLDRLPPGILVWRALLQWLGGLAFIVMAVAVLPALNVGGMQMFRIEILSAHERAARFAGAIVALYVGLTAVLLFLLLLAGMPAFDAMVHAMSTIATGGFSTSDGSAGSFDSAAIEVVLMLGMIAGGMPILLFFQVVHGNWRGLLKDEQVRWYLGLLFLGTAALSLWLARAKGLAAAEALRTGAFTAISAMTGTGLYTVDYSEWTGMPVAVLFFLTFVGGCSGSTAGGVKVFRLKMLFANALVQVRRLMRPHAILIPTFNRKPISEEVLGSVMGFLFVYALSFALLAMALAFLGVDLMTALSGAASAIANKGGGLGQAIGPAGTYAPLPDAAKYLLSAGMLFGRLELFTVLVLFVPGFWKQ